MLSVTVCLLGGLGSHQLPIPSDNHEIATRAIINRIEARRVRMDELAGYREQLSASHFIDFHKLSRSTAGSYTWLKASDDHIPLPRVNQHFPRARVRDSDSMSKLFQ